MEDEEGFFKNMFKGKETYINVKEGKQGIETYINPNIKGFNSAYKSQLISFLQGVIKELNK